MAITTGTGVPTSFRAGDTTAFTVEYGDYPASTWTLTFYFRREGEDTIEHVASQSGSTDAFILSLSDVDTAEFAPGRWKWFTRASLQGTGSIIAASGTLDVFPDPAAPAHEKTFAELALAAIEKALLGDIPTGADDYTIGGVSISKQSTSERLANRDSLKAEVARERNRRRLQEGSNTPSRFGLQVRFK